MIVFDVDGTLVGGESSDWECFGSAFAEVAGFPFAAGFFEEIEEVTAQAIVHHALASLDPRERKQREYAVRDGYLRRLKQAHGKNQHAFSAIEGAVALIAEIKERGIPLAIATGDWRETITFKLWAAGISTDGITMVTSSEHYSRADIIASAVSKTGRSLNEAIYVGDGLWDLRACNQLGIPFIGVGHRRAKLQRAGASQVLADLTPIEFWKARNAVTRRS